MKTSRLHGVLASFAVVAVMLAGTLAIAGCSSSPKGGQIEART
jgi:outer membrane murein-binding lipoprotein Lpp